MNQGPLTGVRITEFTSAWAGPYATCLLAFLGADVIKVESRRRPDLTRLLHYIDNSLFATLNESNVYNSLNLNKNCVSLNLSTPKAVDIAKQLVRVSDVVMENMRPGVMQRLGLGYEALQEVKPDLIYLSSSACGQTGPEREYIGYAPTFGALSGMCHMTGYEDWQPSVMTGAADLRSATSSAFAILAALYYHQQTGEGQYIDLASQEVMAAHMGDVLFDCAMNQNDPIRQGNQNDLMAPHNCYPCAGVDKWISIAVSSQEEWKDLCRVMGKPELAEDSRFYDLSARKQNEDELDDIIGKWTINHDYYDLTAKLQAAGVAAAPSMSGEALFHDPHLKSRQTFKQVDHPFNAESWFAGPPWKLSETPAGIHRRAPLFGEHTDELLARHLGMSPEEIEALREERVIY